LRTNCAGRLEPSQTMMGPEQEGWLFDNLADVKARWTVIGQQVYSFAYDRAKANPDGQFLMDKWDGYVAARQRLYNRLLETRAPNPIVLSGDVHQHYGADLKIDFTNPRSATVGVEFTNTSVTTNGDGSDVGITWEATRGDNPPIRYHSNRRGYIACTATPVKMRADFRIIEKVSVPDLPARIGGSLVVHAGRPGSTLTEGRPCHAE
jgi:alkaline phosphatase D